MKSIKTKLVLLLSLFILTSSISIGITSIRASTRTAVKEAEKTLSSIARESAKLTKSRIDSQKMIVEMLAINEDIKSMDWEKQRSVLQKYAKETSVLDLAIVHLDGTAYYPDGSTSQLGDREYVQKAFQGKANVSDLLVSRVTNNVVLMFAAPIINDGKVDAAVIARMDGNTLSDLASDTGFGKDGYGYLVNDKGTVVGHPDRDLVLSQFNPLEESKVDESYKPLASVVKYIIEKKSGVTSYSHDGMALYASFAPVEDSNWFFVITASEDEVLSSLHSLQLYISIIVTVILLTAMTLAFFLGRTIAKPIIEAVKYSENIANLNLSTDVPTKLQEKKDEIGVLARAIQTVIDNLNKIMQEINVSSENVANGARLVSESSLELSQATTEQASSVEELSASLKEISVHTKHNANKANEANALASNTRNNALNCNEKMTRMLEAMEEINVSSNNISSIIKVIDDIAFQTNILALNAAVEAARAQEHGRGFSVVAEEVRNLAQRSAQAAKETSNLIKNSIRKAENGAKIAEETAVELNKIVEDITRVAELVKSIADASNEQSMGIAQISEGIFQVSQVIQSNTATSEEGAAASEHLSNQADFLRNTVARFKLKEMKMDNDAMPKEEIAAKPVNNKTYRNTDFGKY
ncbi:MAG TPA: methyl-accepting chemotaxis protein [Clostridia bacterium]|nr:methyl-accepting chemotaxis protein [Clostridia bacterium]